MSQPPLNTPVLLAIFRRPQTTRAVLERIAQVRPRTLLVIADGPRSDRPGEAEQCAEARRLIDAVNWPCEIRRHYADTNLGLRRRMASGLTWAFEQSEEVIILEDDCVPDPSFFFYCQELLERYRNEQRIMVIGGSNFHPEIQRPNQSYYFSLYNHCWGWASWRRAWRLYDDAMTQWPQAVRERWLDDILPDARAAEHWQRSYERLLAGQVDSWAMRWTFACWVNRGLTILPSTNLVSNVGFGDTATHTSGDAPWTRPPVVPLTFPLRHPPEVVRDKEADLMTERLLFSPPAHVQWRRMAHQVMHRWVGRR